MPWIQLKLETSADTAPTFEDALMELGAVSVTMEDSADQPLYEPPPGETPLWNATRVTALFDSETEMALVVAALESQFETLPAHRIEALEDKDWIRAWMDQFHPLKFGNRLWIVPTWREAPEPNAVNVLLDPGLAFGTGTHQTTALCLEWLDGLDLSGKTTVDYGCGSGILGIAAKLLGAERVWAVDNDPQALLATRENAQRNECGDTLEVYPPERCPSVQVDVVVANILANPLIELAPRLASLCKPDGLIALSGILERQADAVCEAYSPWFTLDPVKHFEGWVRISGRKNP